MLVMSSTNLFHQQNLLLNKLEIKVFRARVSLAPGPGRCDDFGGNRIKLPESLISCGQQYYYGQTIRVDSGVRKNVLVVAQSLIRANTFHSII